MCKIIVQTHWVTRRRKVKFKEHPLKWILQLILRKPLGPLVPVRHLDIRLEEDEELMG